MKIITRLLALLSLTLALTASAAQPAAPVVTVDLYGNVFLDGQNTNSQIADFARNNPALAPQVDGAVRDLVLAARARIAADVKAAQDAAAAQIAAKEAEKVAAVASAEQARDAAIAAHAAAKAAEISALKARIAALEAADAARNARTVDPTVSPSPESPSTTSLAPTHFPGLVWSTSTRAPLFEVSSPRFDTRLLASR